MMYILGVLCSIVVALLAQETQRQQTPQSKVTYHIPGTEDTLAFWHSFNVNELEEVLARDTLAYVLDIRALERFAVGHIAGAYNIPLEQISKRMAELEAIRKAERNMIIIADREIDARRLCQRLLKKKFYRVWYLRGGFSAWIQAGKPVVSSDSNR